ncbi:MAG: peptidoglycan-binding protein [Cohaesibacteraceae bacterium]
MRKILAAFALATLMQAPAASALAVEFVTPSGNIYCWLDSNESNQALVCIIENRQGPVAAQPTRTCTGRWGHVFLLPTEGNAELRCLHGLPNTAGINALGYGRSIEFAGYRCESQTTGLTCRNRTLNGFFLSRNLQTLDNGPQQAAAPLVEGGTIRAQVADIQQQLNALGFDAGTVDGVPGPQTRGAVSSFQSELGAQVTGTLTTDQYTALFASGERPATTLVVPSETQIALPAPNNTDPFDGLNTQNITQVAQALSRLGFNTGQMTGGASRQLLAALNAFRNQNGLPSGPLGVAEQQLMLALAGQQPAAQPDVEPAELASPPQSPILQQAELSAQPVILEERVVMPVNSVAFESDYMAIAGLQLALPSQREQVVRSLMSSGRLIDFVSYEHNAWKDATQVSRATQELVDHDLPILTQASLEIASSREHMEAAFSNAVFGDGERTIELASRFDAQYVNYARFPAYRGSEVSVELDLTGLPDFSQVVVTDAEVARFEETVAGASFIFPKVYAHIDVTYFGPDETGTNLVLRGEVTSADVRGTTDTDRESNLFFNISLTDAPSQNIAPTTDLYSLMETLETDPQYERSEPLRDRQFMDGRLDLRVAGQGVRPLVLSTISSLIDNRPDLLGQEYFALGVAPELLSVSERRQLVRGTPLADGRSPFNDPFRWHQGLDAFSRRDIADRVANELRSTIEDRAFSADVPAIFTIRAGLLDYDFDAQAFPLNLNLENRSIMSQWLPGLPIQFVYEYPTDFIAPTAIEMPQDEARAFLGQFENRDSPVGYLAIEMKLPSVGDQNALLADYTNGPATGRATQPIAVEIEGLTLYADIGLTQLLHRFDTRDFQPEVQRVGGRTPHEVYQLQRPTLEQLVGRVAHASGAAGRQMLDVIAQRSPVFEAVAPEDREAFIAQIGDELLAERITDDVWVNAEMRFVQGNPNDLIMIVDIFPVFGALPRGEAFDSNGVSFSSRHSQELAAQLRSELSLDLDTLVRARWLSEFHRQRPDRIAERFQELQGNRLTRAGGGRDHVYVVARVDPVLEAVEGDENSRSFVIQTDPRMREYYILVGDVSVPGDLEIIAHEVIETTRAAPPAETSLLNVPQQTEPVVLDSLAEELLVIREAGDTLTDQDYHRLILTRWYYENRAISVGGQPRLGSFFPIGTPKPTRANIDSYLPSFRPWIAAHANALPPQLLVRLGSIPQEGVPNYLRQRHFGGAMAPSQWRRACENGVDRALRTQEPWEATSQIWENGCMYLEQAALYAQRELIVGESRSLERREPQERALNPEGYIGFRASCSVNGDDYCQPLRQALEDPLLAGKIFTFDSIFRVDQLPYVTAADRDILAAQLAGGATTMQLLVNVEAVQAYDALPPSDFNEAQMRFIDFIEPYDNSDMRLRNRPLFEHRLISGFVFDLTVESAAVFNWRDQTIVHTYETMHTFEIPDESLLGPVDTPAITLPNEPYGHDILGVRLGMTFDEADSIIRGRMDVARVLTLDPTHPDLVGYVSRSPMTSIRVYLSADERQLISLFDLPDVAEGRVLAMTRQLAFEPGQLTLEMLEPRLIAKYGEPQITERRQLGWFENGIQCNLLARDLDGRWLDESGNPAEFALGRSAAQPQFFLPHAPQDLTRERNHSEDCQMHLRAQVWDLHTGSVFVQILFDRNTFRSAVQARTEAMVGDETGLAADLEL